MFVLGGVIFQFVRARDYRYYLYTIVARWFIVVVMTTLYFKTRDPLFLVLDAIVLIGLLPSIYVAANPCLQAKRFDRTREGTHCESQKDTIERKALLSEH